MYKPRFLLFTLRYVVACAILLVGVAGLFSTSALAAPLGAVPGWSVTIPAGSTGSITISGIALQPGATLPTGSLDVATQPLAPDSVRTALFYGIDWGYADTAPDQVALAVWWMQNNTWAAADHTIAQRIADAAASSQGTPGWNPDGHNLLTVVQGGQATIAPLSLTPSAQNASLGSGTLLVTNTGINSVTVYLPYGTLFSNASGQVLVWASGTANHGPTASPTSQTAATANATATLVAPTNTPTDTPAPSQKDGGLGQPTATATLTARPKISPTPIPPTDTPAPSSTPIATDTPTTLPTAAAPAIVQPTDAPQGTKPQNQSGTAGTQDNSGVQANTAQPNTLPESVVGGPPLPAGTATSTSRSSNGDIPNAGPAPLGTANAAATPAVPQGVSTAASESAPPAQATFQVPVAVPSGVTLIPTGVPSHAAPVPTATTRTSQGNSDVKPTAAAQKPTPVPTVQKPTPAPTKPTPAPTAAPPPAQVLPPSSKNGGGGIVDTTTGGGKAPTADGSPPKVNPVTGGGPSSLPIWLGAASFLMVLGGWMLRRAGRRAVAAR